MANRENKPYPKHQRIALLTRSCRPPFPTKQVNRRQHRLPRSLGDQPQNRNQQQVHRALDALSPFDAVSRARLRKIIGEPLGTISSDQETRHDMST